MSDLKKSNRGGSRPGAGQFAKEPMEIVSISLPSRVADYYRKLGRGSFRKALEKAMNSNF